MVPVLITTRDNRVTGLLQELEAALREEESSIALWRAQASLRSMAGLAGCLGYEIEQKTREIHRASNARRRSPKRLP